MSGFNISQIENQLKSDPSQLSDNDLFTYIYKKSNNQNINPDDSKNNIPEFLNRICRSFAYENIFINTSNYSMIVSLIVGLLIPFYYFFPRFYKMGIIALIIGLSCFMGLVSKMNDMYSLFFPNIHIILIAVSFVIYFVFFIMMNKLNHISLFFICVIIAFLIITYILKFILLLPIKNGPYSDLKVKENNNIAGTDYVVYDLEIEAACLEVVKRYKLKLPSGNMLYSYLTTFTFSEADNLQDRLINFFTNIFGPLISVGILFIIGWLFSILKYKSEDVVPGKNIFSIIGISEETDNYLFCQANYVLPEYYNNSILIDEYINKIPLRNNDIYLKTFKALNRITNEFLNEYNPQFKFDKNNIDFYTQESIKDNKIIIKIKDLIQKSPITNDKLVNSLENKNQKSNNIKESILSRFDEIINNSNSNSDSDLSYENLKNNIKAEFNKSDTIFLQIIYENKVQILDLIEHLQNKLSIENDLYDNYIKNFNEYIDLAKDAINNDTKITENDKSTINKIIENYQDDLKKNIEIKELDGYHYNIIGYNWFGQKNFQGAPLWCQTCFKYILRLLSAWILFAKPIGSGWFLAKCLLFAPTNTTRDEAKDFRNIMSNRSFIWRYFLMGFDTSNYKNDTNSINPTNDWDGYFKIIKDFSFSSLISIITIPLLIYYNITVFGFQANPSWMNLVIQAFVAINIISNLLINNANEQPIIPWYLNYRWFNVIFLSIGAIGMLIWILVLLYT